MKWNLTIHHLQVSQFLLITLACCRLSKTVYTDVEKFINRQANTQTDDSLLKDYTKEAKGYGSRGPQYDSNSYFMITRLGPQVCSLT